MRAPAAKGFTLLELMLALALGSVVLTITLQLVMAVNGAFATRFAVSEVQGHLLIAEETISAIAAPAGSTAEPWINDLVSPVAGSREGIHGPELVLRQTTPVNCLGNDNTVLNPAGQPMAFLRESHWQLLPGNRLAETCHYGPVGTPGTRQLTSATRVEGIEAFDVRFALDSDKDGVSDAWVRAGNWPPDSNILGIRYALLFASSVAVGASSPADLSLLGNPSNNPNDGKFRLVLERTIAFEALRS